MNKEVKEQYEQFAKDALGFEYHDINLLITALTHRSYVNEHKNSHAEHNERLEFLGDAVLQIVISDYLFLQYKNSPEGDLTNFRKHLVCEETLARLREAAEKTDRPAFSAAGRF